jgi:hypothetical protein
VVSSSRRGPERQCTRKDSDEVRPFSLRVGEELANSPEISDTVMRAIARAEHAPVNARTITRHSRAAPRNPRYPCHWLRGDRVLGVLSLARLEASPAFGPEDLPLVQQLARQCALAVDNVSLYREAQERYACARNSWQIPRTSCVGR